MLIATKLCSIPVQAAEVFPFLFPRFRRLYFSAIRLRRCRIVFAG